MVLVLDPGGIPWTVTVYRSAEDIRVLSKGDTMDGDDGVPGWKLSIAEFFGG